MNGGLCQCRVGRILKRSCEFRAQFQCASCNLALCSRHAVQKMEEGISYYCPQCSFGPRTEGDTTTDRDYFDSGALRSSSWHSHGNRHHYHDRDTGNDTIKDPQDPSDPDSEAFTDEELKAFDDPSDFQKEFSRDGSFDS